MTYIANGTKPFRRAAAILFILIIIEIIGILNTPTYEKELEEARKEYESVLMWSMRY